MFHRILRREPSRIQPQHQTNEDTIKLIDAYQEEEQEKIDIAIYIPEPPEPEPPKVFVIEEEIEEPEEIEDEKTPEELEEEIKKLNKKLHKRLSMTGYLGTVKIDEENPVIVKTVEINNKPEKKKFMPKFKN